jgi:hypothetical protein
MGHPPGKSNMEQIAKERSRALTSHMSDSVIGNE